MIEKKRIEFFDLAKGFCIMLVVVHHLFGMDLPYANQLTNIRMPLYFMLSGIFFKEYESFIGFAVRKVNKLLIPFSFWYFIMSVLIPWLVFYVFNIEIWGYSGGNLYYAVLELFTKRISCNSVVWFLLCLFWMNIYFYIIKFFSNKNCRYQNVIIIGGALFVGATGVYLGYNCIQIPGFFDSAMTATPFFCFGYFLYRKTNLLQSDYMRDKRLLFLALALFGIFIVLFFGRFISYYRNLITIDNLLLIYPMGFIGALSIMLLAKFFNYLPVFSYFGRYSIIILCTHSLLIKSIEMVLVYLHVDLSNLVRLFILLFLVSSYYIIIPFCIKYLPYVTAQKDVFRVQYLLPQQK